MDMKELRERQKLRTVDVASRIGIGESTVRNWEKGRTIPKLRIDQFNQLLKLYQCNFEDLTQAVEKTNITYGTTSQTQQLEES
ncbi:helix-turn-helix transcriptional regulator [Cronbergia sp. UHCC 0137]|uniref:helix-turn-helix domain-containing protein n=1 Tax=Cronbergia sp. UHCC 0137 TaxID=3110239 RepID=UPI002B217CD8|nr:helix-turn-helix transcriptional regulator [Cronbergia sp. UHCC 0137]MEA5617515.1 helix-turn-helix transcriptional regulator [Cronbergia sp. UHCC 0137]